MKFNNLTIFMCVLVCVCVCVHVFMRVCVCVCVLEIQKTIMHRYLITYHTSKPAS